jgi:DNA-binding XRE family transcriptional regulator
MKSKLELLNLIQNYIDENYIQPEPTIKFSKVKREGVAKKNNYMDDSTYDSLITLMKTNFKEFSKVEIKGLSASQHFNLMDELNNTWSTTIFSIIDEKHYKDSEVYKRAGISKQTFSKIRKDPEYRPKRDTAIQICIGLELNLEDSNELLSRAGFGLSKSVKRDLVISFFIERKIYNIREINYALYDLGLELFK